MAVNAITSYVWGAEVKKVKYIFLFPKTSFRRDDSGEAKEKDMNKLVQEILQKVCDI